MAQPPASGADLSQLVAALLSGNQISTKILAQLMAGIAVVNRAPSYTVATLPVTAAPGMFAWASDARKGGEGHGAGTGLMVFWNTATSQWLAVYNNVAPTS